MEFAFDPVYILRQSSELNTLVLENQQWELYDRINELTIPMETVPYEAFICHNLRTAILDHILPPELLEAIVRDCPLLEKLAFPPNVTDEGILLVALGSKMLRHALLPRDDIRVGQAIRRLVTSITPMGLLHLRHAVKLKEIVLTETHCGHLVRDDVLDAWLTELPCLQQVEINISWKAMPPPIGYREVDWFRLAENFACGSWNRACNDGEEDKKESRLFI